MTYHCSIPVQSLGGVFSFQGSFMTTMTPNALRNEEGISRAEELADFILPRRAAGQSYRQIANALREAGTATANGGAWGPKQVHRIVQRLERNAEAQAASRDPLAALLVPMQPTLPADVDPLAILPLPAPNAA